MSVIHERPGVYSQFETSSVVTASDGAGVIGAAGHCSLGETEQPVLITSYAQAVARFGDADTGLVPLIRMAFTGGAARVYAMPVVGALPATAAYQKAFAALCDIDDLPIVICDSEDVAVQQALRDAVCAASNARRERLAVVGASGTVEALIAQAGALQSERVMLVAPAGVSTAGADIGAPYAAAAVAGVLSQTTDPALPLSGAVVPGLSGVVARYEENDIDALILGGVTPLEAYAGQVSVIRAVTTRTKTGEIGDATWRELSTVRIADAVISDVRNALRARFSRAKNTAQTRDAVKSQVIMELEAFKTREIIDGYQNVSVTQSEDSPTVCLVAFQFAVAHALNQIHLTAHILI